MSEIISVVSGKGGVGKTFFSINISYALSLLKKRVLLIDLNITTPNLSIDLEYEKRKTIHEFLSRKCKIEETIVRTKYGFDFIPGSIKVEDLVDIDLDKLPFEIQKISGRYDFIILDSSAGLGRETLTSLKSSTSSLIITTQEKASLLESIRTTRLVDKIGIPILGIIINRYKKKMDLDRVEILIGKPIYGIIHEDKNVEISLDSKVPLLKMFPDSIASIDIKRIAEKLTGEKFEEKKESLFNRIFKIWK